MCVYSVFFYNTSVFSNMDRCVFLLWFQESVFLAVYCIFCSSTAQGRGDEFGDFKNCLTVRNDV